MKERIKEIYNEKRKKYDNDINFKRLDIEQKSQLYNQLFSEAIQEAHMEMLTMKKAGIV